MARSASSQRDTSIQTYRTKRDFTATSEPAAAAARVKGAASPGLSEATSHAPIFVVQKHHAHRAGLHWDFRLEHNGVLWSWAVRKGPSLDPTDKRIAAHVEDHPLDYADFEGTIPDGNYGAGTVATWDRGTWKALIDPDEGLRDGEIKFVLSGQRLNGKFTLVRLKPKPNQRGHQDNWLLIKGHDAQEKAGANAEALEAAIEPPLKRTRDSKQPPMAGAVRRKLPDKQAPQLASVAEGPPDEDGWLTEIKFDGYRILASVDQNAPPEQARVRLLTRNGNDWTSRLPAVAQAIGQLAVGSALVDGELVALDKDGISSFPALQAALSAGRDQDLVFYLFDLLHLDGWDFRGCALRDRKQRLAGLDRWHGMLRYSDHHEGEAVRMRKAACQMKLEGIICKKADAHYHAGRSHDWLKVKCQGREELLVLGWTEPAGSRTGLGALHLGYYDPEGRLHYAGGAGTGFSDEVLETLREQMNGLGSPPPRNLIVAGEDLERTIHWVKPELVAEISFTAWSGAGRIRHAVFLGLREDKAAKDVVRDPADPAAERRAVTPKAYLGSAKRSGPTIAIPPTREERGGARGGDASRSDASRSDASRVGATKGTSTNATASPAASTKTVRSSSVASAKTVASAPVASAKRVESSPTASKRTAASSSAASTKTVGSSPVASTKTVASSPGAPLVVASSPAASKTVATPVRSAIVTARAPRARTETIEGVTLTHPDRALWPGITKRDLVTYWQTVAEHALPGLAARPLAILRCPEGVEGEHFFQKHGHGTMPPGIRDGVADKAPFLAIDGVQGLVSMAQMSAVELHVWGSSEADPLHPDQLVFDLDPGEGVKVPEIVAAALDMRDKLAAIGLASFCRTSGGKGLHVVVPLRPEQAWDPVRAFCKSFAEGLSETNPEKYLAHVKIADRHGRILIDWLRNGLGSTAVASFCPRARAGAGVATPLAWKEVTPKLDLGAFTLRTVPERLRKLPADPWADFEASRRSLPAAPKREGVRKAAAQPAGKATIVTAKAPKPRARG